VVFRGWKPGKLKVEYITTRERKRNGSINWCELIGGLTDGRLVLAFAFYFDCQIFSISFSKVNLRLCGYVAL
jgi:hypothetical protein